MEISACTLLCYPYIFNVLLYTHVINIYVCTKHIIVLNKPTTTTTHPTFNIHCQCKMKNKNERNKVHIILIHFI